MYVDLWGWFWQEERNAYRNNDDIVKQVIELARQGWMYRRNAQSNLMLQSFEQAAAIAREHHNPCWELFATYWACSTLFYHVDDLQAALERTVKLVARAHEEAIIHCPIRSRIYFLLADIYYEIDVFGYEDKIRESLTFIETEIASDEDTYFRVQHRFADLAFLHEDYDAAFERVTAYMAKIEDNDFRMRSANQLLRLLAYARGDLTTAYEHSIQAEKYARTIQSHVDIGVEALWQAAFLQHLDDQTTANAKYLQGNMIFITHDLPHWPDYYNAMCDYLETNNQPTKALEKRNQQIEEYTNYGSWFYLGLAHLQKCRLLQRMKPDEPDVKAAMQAARAISQNMLKPALYLEKLAQIEAGNCYEYAWQKPTDEG